MKGKMYSLSREQTTGVNRWRRRRQKKEKKSTNAQQPRDPPRTMAPAGGSQALLPDVRRPLLKPRQERVKGLSKVASRRLLASMIKGWHCGSGLVALCGTEMGSSRGRCSAVTTQGLFGVRLNGGISRWWDDGRVCLNEVFKLLCSLKMMLLWRRLEGDHGFLHYKSTFSGLT